jgi:hypothetical protein
MLRVCESSVWLIRAATKLPSDPSSLATIWALRTSIGPASWTFVPSAAEYGIVVACGEIMLHPVVVRTSAPPMASDAMRRRFTDPP